MLRNKPGRIRFRHRSRRLRTWIVAAVALALAITGAAAAASLVPDPGGSVIVTAIVTAGTVNETEVSIT